MERKISPALIRSIDLEIEDHGYLILKVDFDYGGMHQGLGYDVDTAFIRRFMRACGVYNLKDCVGRVVLVNHDHGNIYGIYPMEFDRTRAVDFDISIWVAEKQAQVQQREDNVKVATRKPDLPEVIDEFRKEY